MTFIYILFLFRIIQSLPFPSFLFCNPILPVLCSSYPIASTLLYTSLPHVIQSYSWPFHPITYYRIFYLSTFLFFPFPSDCKLSPLIPFNRSLFFPTPLLPLSPPPLRSTCTFCVCGQIREGIQPPQTRGHEGRLISMKRSVLLLFVSGRESREGCGLRSGEAK